MAPSPLRNYASPAYPTFDKAERHAQDLKDHLLPSWSADPRLATIVVTFLAVSLNSCTPASSPGSASNLGAQSASHSSGSPAVSAVVVPVDSTVRGAKAPASSLEHTIVAPVFDHGDGRGAIGCVVMSPPVFLAEDEAMSVVREELAKVGVHLTASNLEIPGIPNIAPQGGIAAHSPRAMSGAGHHSASLSVDGRSRSPSVAVEFISQPDCSAMRGPSYSSVESFDFKGLAQTLVQKLSKEGKAPIFFGVFYDPAVEAQFNHSGPPSTPKEYEELLVRTKDASKDQLRAQVRDFIQWLRAQGAL